MVRFLLWWKYVYDLFLSRKNFSYLIFLNSWHAPSYFFSLSLPHLYKRQLCSFRFYAVFFTCFHIMLTEWPRWLQSCFAHKFPMFLLSLKWNPKCNYGLQDPVWSAESHSSPATALWAHHAYSILRVFHLLLSFSLDSTWPTTSFNLYNKVFGHTM